MKCSTTRDTGSPSAVHAICGSKHIVRRRGNSAYYASLEKNYNTLPVIGIDPGSEVSAYVVWDDFKIQEAKKDVPNNDLLPMLRDSPWPVGIEMVQSFGMPVGREVFETVVWIGRFVQSAQHDAFRIMRHTIKKHFCGCTTAKDSNIRQALIDRFGPPGKKKTPGTTYGLAGDSWQAFAVAVYLQDWFTAGSCAGGPCRAFSQGHLLL